MQSRRGSAVEAVVNLAVGYGVSLGLTWWWFSVTPRQAAGASVVFTVASLVRSYGVRRVFTRWE
jgi:hypothetical protein